MKVPDPGPAVRRAWQWTWRAAVIAAALFLQLILIRSVPYLLPGGEKGADRPVADTPGDLDPFVIEEGHVPLPVVDDPAPAPQNPASTRGNLTISKEPFTGDLDGMIRRRNIRVLTTFNRTNFFIVEGVQKGFEYSLLRDYEKKLNGGKGRRDLKVHMEFIPVHRDELIPKLLAGEGDIAAAGLTITQARLRKVDFTTPYLDGIDEVVVTSSSVKGIEELEDLSGKRVRVRESSSYYESLLALNGRLEAGGKKPVRIVKVPEGLETEDILELVSTGVWEITVADNHLAQIWSGALDDLEVREDLKVREGGKIAWMIRKNSPRLRESLDGYIRTRRKGTKFGNIYFNRYFKDSRWVARPLAARKKVEEYRAIFEKYGKKYDIPWLFAAAVAFQESGFDNSKRSAAGAVGVMQVLPSTAADKNVGIPNVEELENNIHAGMKYLDFLRDRYFSEEEIDDLNKIHFTLASYNAGPGNIRKARSRAGEYGVKNSDRWFKNVEVVTLRTVSQEPVQYVANIHRYYLLFDQYIKSLAEKEALKAKEKKSR